MIARPRSSRLAPAGKFFREFRRYKTGILGIVIILFFASLAILAPLLTNDDPIKTQNLAAPYSIPQWAKSFPQYADYPVNSQLLLGSALSAADLSQWKMGAAVQKGVFGGGGNVTYGPAPGGGVLVTINPPAFVGIGSTPPTFWLNQTFNYPYSYACDYHFSVSITPKSGNVSTNSLFVNGYVKSVGGKVYHLLGPDTYTNPEDSFSYEKTFQVNNLTTFTADSIDPYAILLATGRISAGNLGQCGMAQRTLTHEGNVTVSFAISAQVPATVLVTSANFDLQGRAFGLMGTDQLGRDVWSQFVYGSRVSLEVGLVAALIAVLLGTLVGVSAGYLGGFADEGLMRFTDFMLILPFLPLLLITIIVMSVGNVSFPLGTEFLIIVFIAAFSWQGIARVLRAQVLTLKSRQFVEASKALGSNDRHIIWKHILPNVTGLIYANLALTVPGAILTEAAITFLGFGAPNVISWGTMVSDAQEAVTSTLHSFVWWWFLPPGLAIALLSMAFLFVGFALDAVLNPKLRRR